MKYSSLSLPFSKFIIMGDIDSSSNESMHGPYALKNTKMSCEIHAVNKSHIKENDEFSF